MTAVLVGAVAALMLFDAWQAARLAPTAQAVVEATAARTAAITRDAGQALAEVEGRAEQMHLQAQERALFAGEVALTSGLRMALAECYMNWGEWRIDQCGIAPDDYRGRLLEHVTLQPGGAFELSFGPALGVAAGRLRFQPAVSAVGVRWDCSTGDYPSIAGVLPGCVYLAEAATHDRP
jgi:hypothetical protein